MPFDFNATSPPVPATVLVLGFSWKLQKAILVLFVLGGGGGRVEAWETEFSCSCKICGKVFTGTKLDVQKKAKAHVVVTHLDGDYEFACPECDTVCNNRMSLRWHLRKNHGINAKNKDLDQFKRKPLVAEPEKITS